MISDFNQSAFIFRSSEFRIHYEHLGLWCQTPVYHAHTVGPYHLPTGTQSNMFTTQLFTLPGYPSTLGVKLELKLLVWSGERTDDRDFGTSDAKQRRS